MVVIATPVLAEDDGWRLDLGAGIGTWILDADLADRIRGRIRQEKSPRHVPALILAAPEIPRTIRGKLVELAVRNILEGRPVENADALANPGALAFFTDIAGRI